MTDVLRDLTPPALTLAIEENAVEFLLALGRAGGGEERADERLHWTIGGSRIDYQNAVVRADLAADEVDAAIAASQARFHAHNVPGTWHVGPSMRPASLGERLRAHGFGYSEEVGMALDLDALNETGETPEGLAITRVRDAAELAVWTETLARGFGEGPHEAAWVGAMYGRIGLGDDIAWRHYLARLDRAPVATASMLFAAGVAGIYFVFTVDGARRKGIGAAITLAALREARAMGYRVGVLGSSRMGESVYRRLGFREYCRLGIYDWRPG